jgi:hypothetical protein
LHGLLEAEPIEEKATRAARPPGPYSSGTRATVAVEGER